MARRCSIMFTCVSNFVHFFENSISIVTCFFSTHPAIVTLIFAVPYGHVCWTFPSCRWWHGECVGIGLPLLFAPHCLELSAPCRRCCEATLNAFASRNVYVIWSARDEKIGSFAGLGFASTKKPPSQLFVISVALVVVPVTVVVVADGENGTVVVVGGSWSN